MGEKLVPEQEAILHIMKASELLGNKGTPESVLQLVFKTLCNVKYVQEITKEHQRRNDGERS
jgi:hypothetical protein